MKWLLKMLQKPVARPAKAARPATAQAVKPAEDSHGLRAALAVATDAAASTAAILSLGWPWSVSLKS